MPVNAVGFDLDYTLAVPSRSRTVLLQEAIDTVEAPSIARDEYLEAHRRNLTQDTRTAIFDDLLSDRNSDTSPAELARAYRELINNTLVPVPAVETLLTELRETYRVGLLTNGPTIAQREKLRILGWEDMFDEIVISGDLVAGKPDSRAFKALLDGLNAAPDETVYVGDELTADIKGAASAGLYAIQVIYSGGPAPDDRADAHIKRDDLSTDLPLLLSSID